MSKRNCKHANCSLIAWFEDPGEDPDLAKENRWAVGVFRCNDCFANLERVGKTFEESS